MLRHATLLLVALTLGPGPLPSLAAADPAPVASAPVPDMDQGAQELSFGALPPGEPGKDYDPVVVPNGSTLAWKVVDGVKVFHLIAEPIRHEFAPGLVATVWGYNGQSPGPVIELVEGDHVRFYVTNRLPEKTTVHWHGLIVPNAQDGVAGLTQPGIEPGETAKYEFTVHQHGTFMYHPHYDEMTQMGMGMQGMLIIHPRGRQEPKIDRDFVIMLSEWAIKAGTSRPDTNEMSEFNILTMNSRAYPGTAPLVAKLGDRVRIRFGNLGAMDHHPIHLHGYAFRVVATDGGDIQPAAQWPETTVLVPVGSTRDIQFVANQPGDWIMHCHMTHHVMNQMGHGLPNMVGVDQGDVDDRMRKLLPYYMTMGNTGMGEMAEMGMDVPENSIPMVGADGPHGYIDMGGMFTIVKVRAGLTSYADPGWYQQPKGTQVTTATAAELAHDGIDLTPPPEAPMSGTPSTSAASSGSVMPLPGHP
jgi:FtsP/CotA-like multicopper oxidase with cupredoxin domain